MRVDAVREFLERHGLGAACRQFEVSSATVDLAARALPRPFPCWAKRGLWCWW